MGLLDIYNDYMKRLQGISVEDDFTGMNTDLQVPKKDSEGRVINPMLRDREGGSPLTQTAANQAKSINDSKTPQAQKMPSDPIVMGGSGAQQGDISFMQKLANMANVDFDKAAATWKEKGGFEGLMANPAFTMGLAFMQAGAEGKSIGGAALDSVAKAAGISQQYKKLLAGKTEVLEVTEGDMNQIKNVLNAEGISAPILRKLLPGNQAEKYEQAVEDIAMAVNKKVRARVTAAKKAGKDIQVGTRLYKEIIKDMIAKGEIDKKGGLKLFGYNVIDATLEARAHGGPVHEDKAYMVGEKGPEVFIPKSSGNVIANDDTQIFSMLLAANPQLQKISKDRAMKILKAKFPEYFD